MTFSHPQIPREPRRAPPKIRDLVPDCPEWLEVYILRCLEKKPEDRFESARELYEGLKHHMAGDHDDEPAVEAVAVVAQVEDDKTVDERADALTGDTAFEPSADVPDRPDSNLDETADGLVAEGGGEPDDGGMRFHTAEVQVLEPRYPDLFPDSATGAAAAAAETKSPAETVDNATEPTPEEVDEDSHEDFEVVTKSAKEMHTEVINIDKVLGSRSRPFYRTVWFISLCVVATVGIGVVAFLAQR